MNYNIIVLGGGSAGLVSSYIAAAVKAKVLLVEKHRMGGDCLNTGCVPSKALIRTATLLSHIKRHQEFGLKNATAEIDFAQVMERVQAIIKKVAPHDSVERYTSLGVDCIQGEAKILSPHEVTVNGKIYTTQNIIIATGAGPAIPKLLGLEKIKPLHTDNVWDLREQPKRLVILGGGPIGCELAQCFARLGSQVTQVQTGSQLLEREDNDVIELMQKRFADEGIELVLNSKVVEVKVESNRKYLVVEQKSVETHGLSRHSPVRAEADNASLRTIEFDELLLATGRKPNVTGFGLEELGIKLTDSGAIATDTYCRTNYKNIFACGDCASPYQFTHMAAHGAWYCAVNALFQPLKKFKLDLSIVPWCTYTDPEIARVGLNEKDAKQQNIPYEVSIYPIDDLDRAIADSEDHGMIKVLTKPGSDKILGVTICCHHAGDLLPEYVAAMKHGIGMNKILGTIHVYPTMAEANKYVAGVWKKAHAPQALLKLVEKFHALRR